MLQGKLLQISITGYIEDVDLMARLNFDAYRFLISWSRIFPNGTGTINWKGVAYYNRLIDYLLQRGKILQIMQTSVSRCMETELKPGLRLTNLELLPLMDMMRVPSHQQDALNHMAKMETTAWLGILG